MVAITQNPVNLKMHNKEKQRPVVKIGKLGMFDIHILKLFQYCKWYFQKQKDIKTLTINSKSLHVTHN